MRLFQPGRGDSLALAGRLLELGLLRRIRTSMRSVPSLPVFTLAAPRPAITVTDAAFSRNARYHAASGTPDALDYARMAEVIRGLCRAVADLAR